MTVIRQNTPRSQCEPADEKVSAETDIKRPAELNGYGITASVHAIIDELTESRRLIVHLSSLVDAYCAYPSDSKPTNIVQKDSMEGGTPTARTLCLSAEYAQETNKILRALIDRVDMPNLGDIFDRLAQI